MHKYLVISIGLLLIQTASFAQRQTSSPYSRFGYGEITLPSLQFSEMGSVSNGIRSNSSINFVNPAHHSAIKKETFLFQIGAGYTYRNVSQNTTNASFFNTGLDYFAFAFPIISEKWGSAIGLVPFNSVGYSFYSSDSLANYYYMGDGGINQLVWGHSFTPIKNLSLGFNASYLFGKTNYTSLIEIKNIENAYHTKKYTEYKTNGILWDFGVQYKYEINDLHSVTIGATYRDKQTVGYERTNFLGSYNEELISSNIKKNKKTIQTSYAVLTEIDTVNYTTIPDLRTDIPQQISFGIGYKLVDKLTCGIDAGYQNWENIYVYKKYNPDLLNKEFIRAGIEYTPNYRSTNYFKKLPYRAGFHYTNLPISFESENEINEPVEIGFSLGTDLLLRQTSNSLSVSAEFGKRGDLDAIHGIQEKYCIVKLHINLKETWFFQRKID